MKDRIQQFMSGMQNRQIIASALVVALAIMFGLALYAFRGAIFVDDEQPEQTRVQPSGPEAVFRHPLTGKELSEGVVDLPQVFGVMIDHSVDAWPQAGIDESFYVIEAPVESGITRFLAFFSEEQDLNKIGPVRSARPYYVRWNNGLGALYAHVGGSPASLELIRQNGTLDLNQFSNADTYWRSNRRLAPHNVYTSSELLNAAMQDYEQTEGEIEPDYEPWRFVGGEARGETDVTIDFSVSSYKVDWKFDSETNRYQRHQSGLPFTTEDGSEIFADNIGVMVTDMEVIDNIGRRKIRTQGEGDAYVFKNGEVIQGTWKKPSEGHRVRFYDNDNNEVTMNAGTTWVEVVASDQQVIINEAEEE